MVIKLKDVCDVRDGTHDSPMYVEDGYPLVTSKNIVDGKLDLSAVSYISKEDYDKINERSNVDDGDIIMPMIGTIGNPCLIQGYTDFAIKNVALIKFPNDEIKNKFVLYFLKSDAFKRYVESKNKGGTQKFLSLGDIRNIEIPQLSIAEQKEIIWRLEKVESIFKLRKQELQHLDELIKARFVEMFGECDCKVSTFGQEFSFISRGKSPSYVEESDLVVINQACIYWDGINFDKVKYNDTAYYGDRILQNGDVLVNSTGTGTLGRANVYTCTDNLRRFMADSHITIVRNSTTCCPIYIKCFLEQSKVQEDIYRSCVNGSTNQIELSKEKFKQLKLPVPPMELQKQFADFVAQVDKSKFAVQKALDETQLLFDSLMQKYFG